MRIPQVAKRAQASKSTAPKPKAAGKAAMARIVGSTISIITRFVMSSVMIGAGE